MLPKNEAKYIQSLHHKKFRNQYNAFIAEGPKVVAELIKRKPGWIEKIYATKTWIDSLAPQQRQLLADVTVEVQAFELEKISALQTPQDVLAVASQPQFSYQKNNSWLLMLDGIQDPGNLGTIIRTAHWFGIDQVVCSIDCADAFSPKVVQASMGSVFHMPVVYTDLQVFLTTYDQPVYGALLNGQSPVAISSPQKGSLLIGSEGKGIRPELLPFVNQKITIPGASDAESLNAAVAAGILMNWATGASSK